MILAIFEIVYQRVLRTIFSLSLSLPLPFSLPSPPPLVNEFISGSWGALVLWIGHEVGGKLRCFYCRQNLIVLFVRVPHNCTIMLRP